MLIAAIFNACTDFHHSAGSSYLLFDIHHMFDSLSVVLMNICFIVTKFIVSFVSCLLINLIKHGLSFDLHFKQIFLNKLIYS